MGSNFAHKSWTEYGVRVPCVIETVRAVNGSNASDGRSCPRRMRQSPDGVASDGVDGSPARWSLGLGGSTSLRTVLLMPSLFGQIRQNIQGITVDSAERDHRQPGLAERPLGS